MTEPELTLRELLELMEEIAFADGFTVCVELHVAPSGLGRAGSELHWCGSTDGAKKIEAELRNNLATATEPLPVNAKCVQCDKPFHRGDDEPGQVCCSIVCEMLGDGDESDE